MNNWLQKFVMLILCVPLLAHAEISAKITALKLTKIDHGVRVTVNCDQAIPYHFFTLNHPDRLVIDFENAHSKINLKDVGLNDVGVTSIRTGHPVPRTLRFVFALTSAGNAKIISQPDQNKLMIDVKLSSNKSKKTVRNSPPVKHIITVVIDPGHGGKDPGALGAQNAREKNIVLSIAKRLAKLINHQPNMRAVLTRRGDYFVSLRERLALARKEKADVFVSIHADSFFNDQSTGASVYALSQRGATSEAARWLARRENYSELGGVNLSGLDDQSYVLRSVLIDLAQTATINNSLHLGTAVLGQLSNLSELHYRQVEQAPFMVLKSPDIASVLVETGFLSNPNEEKKLRDAAYQEKIAQAVLSGVRVYLNKYNPVGAS